MNTAQIVAELGKVRTAITTVAGFAVDLAGARVGAIPWTANALETLAGAMETNADAIGAGAVAHEDGEADTTATLADCATAIGTISGQFTTAANARPFGPSGAAAKGDAMRTAANNLLDVAATLNFIVNPPAPEGDG